MSLTSRYCSWCFQKADHALHESNLVQRNVYKCRNCGKRTLECRYCRHMARGKLEGWDDELCLEHSGEIASFARMEMKLKDLSEYRKIFVRDSRNLKSLGVTAACMVAGGAILGPAALYAGPAMASAAGAFGLLGAAGTGTAISSLSGAALTSASLAAIGGGTMAAGTAVITAAGTALGGCYGSLVSNSYFGQVKHFDIRRVQSGNKHAVVFINGFLSERDQSTGDWTTAIGTRFRQNHWYHVDWEASTLLKLGRMLYGNPNALAASFVGKAAARGSKAFAGAVAAPAAVLTAAELARNPWHESMVKAQMVGAMLADAIARTPGWTFTLAGHSLGARVIHFALAALATKGVRPIRNAYLLGGAVSNDAADWEQASRPVSGTIYNCHSDRDSVLKYLYRGANAGLSQPIGFLPIRTRSEQIRNLDCTSLVGGHMEWKRQFPAILRELHGGPAVKRPEPLYI